MGREGGRGKRIEHNQDIRSLALQCYTCMLHNSPPVTSCHVRQSFSTYDVELRPLQSLLLSAC